jgi:uncharacterized protein (TIGR00255 family)
MRAPSAVRCASRYRRPTAKLPRLAHRLGLEIRSVNSRFLDLTFRLPDELRPFEPALRELLTAKLKRGKVEVRAAHGKRLCRAS